MPYLSLLKLNPRSRQAQAEIKDPYQMHRTFAKAFPNDPQALADARCLFRVEDDSEHELRVIVQTRTPPDWSQLTVASRYFVSEPIVKQIQPKFRIGQTLAFRLLANPTVTRDGKRHGIYDEEGQLNWLSKKAGTNGFSVRTVSIVGRNQVRSKKSDTSISLSAARFDGILVVTDVDLFTAAWESGIGAAKGFGFGLLSLAPAS